jgi:hypothetical protein
MVALLCSRIDFQSKGDVGYFIIFYTWFGIIVNVYSGEVHVYECVRDAS